VAIIEAEVGFRPGLTDFLGRSSRTYQVVLGEYDRAVEEGPEQVIPINQGDLFVHPKWNNNCVACG
jgi:hypothetical protein